WQPQALLHANRPEGWLTPGLEGVTVAWSPDGQWLALGLTNEVRLWQTAPWREVARWDGIPVQDLVFDPSGEYLAVAQKGQNDIVVYARESGEAIAHLQGHTNAVLALDWAQTDVGPLLVSAGADGTVRLWDKPLQGENPLVVLDHYVGQAWSVAFAPDHRLVASGAGAGVNRITVRSVVSRQVDLRLPGPTTPEAQVGVYALAFTPDSQQIFSAHAEGMVRVWRLEDCQAPPDAPPFATKTCSPYRAWQEKATTVAVSPNGAWLATAGEAGVVLIRPLPLP
ncbi:MAG: hypothetical protein GXO56_04210, partial [Chloroflexi bacterium]|nr:hypothetical protein [Chloroflexota bacterium]